MANPQVEKGHVRIANELYDEILRRNFSKRQQNLVLFIWRLSYGTGQKDCVIKQFNLFELVGIYRSDIRKELNYLRECAVLNWNEKNMIFSINKNYKYWQITPSKKWDSEKFNDLIHQNIERKNVSKSLTNGEVIVSETPTVKKPKVSKTLTFKSKRVSESLTTKLVKHQQRPSLKLSEARVTRVLNTLLKTLKIKDIKDINNNNDPIEVENVQDAFVFYRQNFEPFIPPAIIEKMKGWLEDYSDEMLILAMEKSLGQGIDKSNWSYVNRILVNWHKKQLKTPEDVEADDEKFYAKQNRRFNKGAKNNEVIPDWFEQQKHKQQAPVPKQSEQDINQEELKAMLKKHAGG